MNYKKVKSPTPLSGFYIAYYGSTMNEHKGIYGISHLMEHLVSYRKFTENQLFECGIAYDQLIMGLGRGERVLINDKKVDGTNTARAICIDRNDGIGGIDL